MLAFAGRGDRTVAEVDLNLVVTEALELVDQPHRSQATVARRLHPGPLLTACDANQMQQVVSNLVLNGIEAYDREPAQITVSTSMKTLTAKEALAVTVGTPAPGPHAVLTVSDTGHGMDEATG